MMNGQENKVPSISSYENLIPVPAREEKEFNQLQTEIC